MSLAASASQASLTASTSLSPDCQLPRLSLRTSHLLGGKLTYLVASSLEAGMVHPDWDRPLF